MENEEYLEKHFHDEIIRMERAYEIYNHYKQQGIHPGFNFPPNTITNEKIDYDDNLIAFLVHVRILHRFFKNIRDPRNDNEMVAKEYIPKWKIEDEWKEMHLKWYPQINNHIFHLNKIRDNGKRERYPIDKIYDYYERVVIDFLKKLSTKQKLPYLLKKLLKDLKKDTKLI